MNNYNQGQQAVILKGIAQQILQMNLPSFTQVNKMFEEFNIDFEENKIYNQLYKAVGVALTINDELKGDINKLQHSIVHHSLNPENDTEFKIREKVLS